MKKMIHHFYDLDEKEKNHPGKFEVYYKQACCICILYFVARKI